MKLFLIIANLHSQEPIFAVEGGWKPDRDIRGVDKNIYTLSDTHTRTIPELSAELAHETERIAQYLAEAQESPQRQFLAYDPRTTYSPLDKARIQDGNGEQFPLDLNIPYMHSRSDSNLHIENGTIYSYNIVHELEAYDQATHNEMAGMTLAELGSDFYDLNFDPKVDTPKRIAETDYKNVTTNLLKNAFRVGVGDMYQSFLSPFVKGLMKGQICISNNGCAQKNVVAATLFNMDNPDLRDAIEDEEWDETDSTDSEADSVSQSEKDEINFFEQR